MSKTASLPQETPLPVSETRDWTTVGHHPFMFTDTGPDPINVILDLRSGIARLPETATLFTLDRVLDQYTPSDIRPEYLALLGSWRAPDSMVGNAINTKYVNPNGSDKYRYTDVYVRCECGTAFKHSNITGAETPGTHDHADGCKPQYHYEAMAELWRRREQVAKTMLLLGTWTGRDVAARVGIKATQVNRFSNKCNLSIMEYRQQGRDLMAATAATLLENHSTPSVAAAYNYSPGQLRAQVRERTDADAEEIVETRRDADRRGEWVPEHSRGVGR